MSGERNRPDGNGAVPKSTAGGPDVTSDGTSPHLLAEAAVLGAAVLSADARAGVLDLLEPDDFDNEAHRATFATLRAMHEAGEHVDQVTLTVRLCDLERIDQAGGYAAVFDLTDPVACPHPSAWEVYAARVRQHGDRRRTIDHHWRELRRLGVVA
jgi:replicative DNA helicase